MATKTGIVALNFEITEPLLLDNYTDYLRMKTDRPPVLSGKPNEEINLAAIEKSFGRFFKATVRGGNAALIPDFVINAAEISEPLADALGIPLGEGEALEVEAKITRGGQGGSTIGQRAILSQEDGQSVGSTALTTAITTAAKKVEPNIDIENKAGVLKAARTALGGAGKFFDLIKDKDPDLFMKFYQKAKLLQISKFTLDKKQQKVAKVNVINIHFPYADFTAPPFAMEITGGSSIVLKLGKSFENNLIKAVLAAGPTIATDSVKDFHKELTKLSGKTKTKLNAGKYDFTTVVEYPSGASIPMTKGRITGTRKGKRKKSIQATITSAQLTASVQRSLFARMPKGPLKGPPLSGEILTNRSGRFVKSVMTQVRGNLIRYYYNPIYQVHESTERAPSNTIEGSIRNITQRQVGRQFNIMKGF